MDTYSALRTTAPSGPGSRPSRRHLPSASRRTGSPRPCPPGRNRCTPSAREPTAALLEVLDVSDLEGSRLVLNDGPGHEGLQRNPAGLFPRPIPDGHVRRLLLLIPHHQHVGHLLKLGVADPLVQRL